MLFDHLAYFQISGEISYKQNQVNYRKNDHIDMKFESRIQVNAVNIKKGKTCGNSRMKVKSSDIFSFLYFITASSVLIPVEYTIKMENSFKVMWGNKKED